MEVVTGALPRLLPKLGDLLISEYNLQKGVKGEIMFLKAELEFMKVSLEDISGTPANQVDNLDKIWARDVRELSYDIEDSIDTFMVRANGGERAEQHGFKKFIDRSLVLLTRGNIRRKIATDIREIKIRVEEVSKRRDRYKIYNNVTKPITIDPRLFSQYKKATELVGVEDARDEIIRILMEGNQVSRQQHKVVSLVGLGGLGKTTLANVVYEKLRGQFDCSAFVSVSQVPDRDKLFKDLLYQLSKQNSASINIFELRELLQNKRYFIILDDLWDISAWNMISSALPDNNRGCKIITTTRIFSVAEQIGIVYKMEPLSLDNSRILLCSRIFGTDEDGRVRCPNEELVEVCNKILKKCAGVPLAITTIASLLASKGTDKIEWYTVYNSIASGLESSQNVNTMRSILSLSYYNLTSHLRTCLLYLSVFPEDFEIGKDRLIWMWIAEGIIHSGHQSKSLFELGEGYFNELVNSSMIQVYESYFGMKIYCRVHDMVLDLIRSLSREENFVTVSYGTDHASPSNMVRRLSLQNGKVDHATTWASRNMQHVRSIVVFPSAVKIMPSLGRFRVVRVLDLEDCDLSQVDSLRHIGKLFHLRYLGLGGTRIAQLPEEIGTLQFLQILDVAGTEFSNLPPTILQLRHLVCLRMEWCRVPRGIGNITSLEELSFVWITDDSTDSLEELGHLTELRVLIIVSFTAWTDSLATSLMECLRKLKKLQTLRIKGVHGECNLDAWVAPRHLRILEIRHCCLFSTLPAWMNCSLHRDLTVLSIAVKVLPQEDFETLGWLPALRYLQLEVGHATLGILQRSLVPPDSFPCLVRCELWGFGEPVAFCQGAMPMLVNLRIELYVLHALVMKEEIASSFPGFDLGLGDLSSLQAVTVDLRCDGASREEVMEGEDFLEDFLSGVAEAHPNNPSFKIDTD